MKKTLLSICPVTMIACGTVLGISRITGEWVSYAIAAIVAMAAGLYVMLHIEKLENELKKQNKNQ